VESATNPANRGHPMRGRKRKEERMAKDNHAQGQHDQEESRDRTGFADIVWDQVFGGKYDPPGDSKGKEEYDAGWDNAEK